MGRKCILAVWIWSVATGCSRKAGDTSPDRSPAQQDTSLNARAAAVNDSGPATGPARVMIGTWDFAGTGVRSPSISVTVDSARGETFYGRLTRAFAGDMGLDPALFRPFAGTVGSDSVASFTMNMVPAGSSPVEMTGKVTGNEWLLSRFLWGGDEQVVDGRTWTGRRAG